MRLTGTADEQYKEWRELLHQLYLEETGGVTTTSLVPAPGSGTSPATPAPATKATPASAPSAADPKAPVHVAVENPEPGTPVRP